MANIARVSLFCLFALALAACGKQEDDTAAQAQQQAQPATLTPPSGTDDKAWREYLMAVVKQNMQGIRNSPYLYYLPSATDPEFEAKYQRQLESVEGTILRTVLPGNMLAFGSPESGRMADLIVAAFGSAEPNAFQGVRVLYIGTAADGDRVRAAVEPSGAGFVFVDNGQQGSSSAPPTPVEGQLPAPAPEAGADGDAMDEAATDEAAGDAGDQ